MTATTLSVVVPTLNESARLPRLLASLEAAGLEPTDEVIVVDGGSADGTPAVARKHGALVLEAPRGRGAQRAEPKPAGAPTEGAAAESTESA